MSKNHENDYEYGKIEGCAEIAIRILQGFEKKDKLTLDNVLELLGASEESRSTFAPNVIGEQAPGQDTKIGIGSQYIDIKDCFNLAVNVAREAGAFFLNSWQDNKEVNEIRAHDIKLRLDVQTQELIVSRLGQQYPMIPVFGEEGINDGAKTSEFRWVVDPIDGTVNFAFDIPHACVSIALQKRIENAYGTIMGVVYDPFFDEIWTAAVGFPTQLNGKKIHVSQRAALSETVVSIGFAKLAENLKISMEAMTQLMDKVRKVRILGSAALDLVYVASGRLDAYVEAGVRLWDIAAGGFILEQAGGKFQRSLLPGQEPETYKLLASNGCLDSELRPLLGSRFDD